MSGRVPRALATILLRPRALATAIAGLLLLAPALGRAGIEEFSTFSVESQEEDDESLLDHFLSRWPHAWRDEWEHSTMALRSSQGCLTSGQWINHTELKARATLGGAAWFGLALRQSEDDRATYDYMEFSFHFPTRIGTAGAMFRPFHDKSRQDLHLIWDVGADTSAFQMRAVLGIEDVFNNFWEFRQSRVGNASEPYLRRPYEPALSFVVRRPSLRAELGGRYLTPSTKQLVVSTAAPNLDHIFTLWGTEAWASLETSALGMTWELAGANQQARSREWPVDTPQPDGDDFRRQWAVEAVARRPLSPSVRAEARWLYQDRTQQHAPPIDPPNFRALDRLVQIETLWTPSPSLGLRFGGLYDRISVQQSQVSAQRSYGSRTESRLYVGLLVRFGRVSLQAVEGIELDAEPYDVWAVHDKGFLQLQASF